MCLCLTQHWCQQHSLPHEPSSNNNNIHVYDCKRNFQVRITVNTSEKQVITLWRRLKIVRPKKYIGLLLLHMYNFLFVQYYIEVLGC